MRISYHNREKDLAKFFSDKDGLIYCNDVNKLMKAVGQKHLASESRLFTDSNKASLKEFFCLMIMNFHPYLLSMLDI